MGPVEESSVIYVIFITALIVASVSYLYRRVSSLEKAKKRTILDRNSFEAVKTETPLDQPVKKARTKAIESTESSFRTFKKFFLIAMVILWCLLILPIPAYFLPNTYIPFLIGLFTVLMGIAMKPLLENIFSGLVFSLGRSLRIGDTVTIDGQYGTVEELRLTYIIVKNWDWKRYIIPNSRLLNKEFTNFSLIDTFQWAHVEFSVAPDTEGSLIRELAVNACKSSKYFANYEEPAFWVMELTETHVKCWVAGWADRPSDAWALTHDIRTFLWESFRAHNIRLHSLENRFQPFVSERSFSSRQPSEGIA